jgi:hypothetical protein
MTNVEILEGDFNYMRIVNVQYTEPLPIVITQPCIIRDSPIHGKGVFATRKILKGEKITVYPCHYLYVNGSICKSRKWRYKENTIEMHNIMNVWSTSFYNMYICGVPYMYEDGLGHMINCSIGPKCLNGNYEDVGNCVGDEPSFDELTKTEVFWKSASRDIEKDEEILYFYGEHYWRTLAEKDLFTINTK